MTPSVLRQPRYTVSSQLQKRWNSDAVKQPSEIAAAESETLAEQVSSEATLTPSLAPEESAAVDAATEAGEAASGSTSTLSAAPTGGDNGASQPWRPTPRRDERLRVPAEPTNICYVGNLFFDVTEEDLKREFSRFGHVEFAKIIYDGRGLSKGFVE